jgi:hypothetical protein
LQRLESEELDRKIGGWFLKYTSLKGSAMAIDGKMLCGSHKGIQKAIQLLGAILHKEGVVVAQKKIRDKTNEIPMVKDLLSPLKMKGSVVTLDALHTQKKTATFIREKKKADYVLVAKDNQKTLKDDIAALSEDDFFSSP